MQKIPYMPYFLHLSRPTLYACIIYLQLSKRVAVLQEELDENDGKNRRGKVNVIYNVLAYKLAKRSNISVQHLLVQQC